MRCFHCQQDIQSDQLIEQTIAGTPRDFCCHGCATVCDSIYGAGLDGFYSRRQDGDILEPPDEQDTDLSFYDIDEVQAEYVGNLEPEREIHLLVEGIHCAACVWLIENSLKKLPGIIAARVNLSGRRLLVKWNNDKLALSRIIASLQKLGYSAVPYDPEAAEGSINRANRQILYRMAVAAFGMMNLMWISIALYTGANQGEFRQLFHWIGFMLATPTLLYSGQPFYRGAWNGLKNRRPSMDLPIAIGVTITYAYSVYVTVTGSEVGEVYYDTVVNFLFVILVGRYLEAISKRHAVASTQRLLDLQPRVATVVRDGQESVVPIRSVLKTDLVRVKPGERIPVDGVVVSGSSPVDEAVLSGESEPIIKSAGNNVSAGTLNGSGSLLIEATELLADSALGKIIHLVEEAQASKAPIQSMADRIVPWFVVVTISLATLTFVYWISIDFEIALLAATAVLIITCPCAFGMATPMSIAVASGLGARNGILVRNGGVLETFAHVDHLVFDKTGTLTEGQLNLVKVATEEGSWSRGLQDSMSPALAQLTLQCAAIERYSEHPIAAALTRFADANDWKLPIVEDFVSVAGKGVKAEIQGESIMLGTLKWMNEMQLEASPKLQQEIAALDEQGVSSICCAQGGQLVAVMGIEDSIRPGAEELIQELKSAGLAVTLLSGDRRKTAEHIAARLGGMDVIAEVLPADKNAVIAELQSQGKQVAMVGDGVNDAPALVRADVGIALGSGTDASIASADIVLMSNELDKVLVAARLSRRTIRTIKQNIGISITYNIIMVPLAMMTFVTPLVAAITMPMSSLLVIGNAARIATLFKKNR